MAKRFLTPLNLPNLASNPETGAEGDLYFNTVDNVIKIYIDSEWTDLQGSASAGNFVIYQDEQPDTTNLPTGTIWVDSDAEIVGGGSGGGSTGGGIGLNNWTENESGDLIPNTTEQNIGSEEYPVKEIYVSGSTIYIGETTLSVEDGELNIGGSKVITESNADDNLDLSNYLTLSTASTTYATKQELEEIDLSPYLTVESASATYLDLNSASSTYSKKLTRWKKTYSASATVITGLDDNENNLIYTPDFELVHINGVLLSTDEYVQTDENTLTLLEAVSINDVVDIVIHG
jgi:hypothetical protein